MVIEARVPTILLLPFLFGRVLPQEGRVLEPDQLLPANPTFSVSQEEMEEHLGLGLNLTDLTEKEQAMLYLALFDSDSDRALDGTELMQSLYHAHALDALSKESEEFSQLMHKIHGDDQLEQFVDGLLEMLDENRDGYLDIGELLQLHI